MFVIHHYIMKKPLLVILALVLGSSKIYAQSTPSLPWKVAKVEARLKLKDIEIREMKTSLKCNLEGTSKTFSKVKEEKPKTTFKTVEKIKDDKAEEKATNISAITIAEVNVDSNDIGSTTLVDCTYTLWINAVAKAFNNEVVETSFDLVGNKKGALTKIELKDLLSDKELNKKIQDILNTRTLSFNDATGKLILSAEKVK